MGSGSTVWCEASTGVGLGASGTFAKQPGVALQYNEVFIPRKMEFKGCGVTNEGVVVMIVELEKIIPGQFHNWDQSRKEHGKRPTKKIVNMWFKNETNLATMIGLLNVVEEALKNVSYKIRDKGYCKIGSASPKETHVESACLVKRRD